MITIEKVNEVFLRVYTEPGIAQELSQFFTFEVPGAKFMPAYKAKLWDGKLRMYDLHRKTLYVGLLDYVHQFAEQNEYEVKHLNDVAPTTDVKPSDIKEYADWLNLHGRGNKIEIRDYQLDAVYRALKHKRKLLLSPTASGKSLIIYTSMRYLLEQGKKCILIVPTVSLVHQMVSDFKDYSTANGWNVDDNVGMIMAGYDKTPKTKTLKLTMEDGSIRRFKLNDVVETKRGKILAKNLTYDDELV